MAGIVGSAVAGEAVRRLSLLVSGEEGHDREKTEIKVERVEMAVLKLETIIAMSEDWQITHAPLLRWKVKLKRVLKEGKGIVRAHRRNTASTSLERMRSNSLPRRMAQVAKRFMPFSRRTDPGDDEDNLTDSAVRRLERIAEGADGFFEFVRCGGGRPRILTFLPSFARSVAVGETTEFSLRMEGGTAVMQLQPWWIKVAGGGDGGIKAAGAGLWMSYEHDVFWDRNFKVPAGFRTSEDVDVERIAANCVVQLPPQFGASCAAAMMEFVAGMASHGRNSSAASAMYACFVRVIRDCVKALHLTEALEVTRMTDERQRIWEAHLPEKTMGWAEAQR